jgi:hypothetical protein
MAGQAPRGSRGQGRTNRPGTSVATTASKTAHGTRPTVAASSRVPGRTPAKTQAPSQTPATRAVYRLLQTKGLNSAEAANLTAFICGLPTTDLRWSLNQINQLLFLRQLRQTGRFDGNDGGPSRPH